MDRDDTAHVHHVVQIQPALLQMSRRLCNVPINFAATRNIRHFLYIGKTWDLLPFCPRPSEPLWGRAARRWWHREWSDLGFRKSLFEPSTRYKITKQLLLYLLCETFPPVLLPEYWKKKKIQNNCKVSLMYKYDTIRKSAAQKYSWFLSPERSNKNLYKI